ncbi:MAG: tRNA uridine-5-carboxymethylaminomethyl(34) synthesis GTPase MnmE [Croceibacterium sp.]
MDTIFALSSGAPPAGIAVVRISGPQAGPALTALAGRLPTPRTVRLSDLRDENGSLLDRGLVLWLPGPSTVTGEDIGELHLHGGRAVVAAVEAALVRTSGLRRAEPGEFTRRAFANGRIDLAEAEGLADLLEAETELQRAAALTTAGGALSRQVEGWRVRVLSLSAQVEAALDFAEQDDEIGLPRTFDDEMTALSEDIGRALDTPSAEALRQGFRVALAGPPNVGKSSLFNVLLDNDAAIATPFPGTTRDVLERSVAIAGVPFTFVDMAGLRDTTADPVEALGIARAKTAIGEADLVLWLGPERDAPTSAWNIESRIDHPHHVSKQSPRHRVSAVRGDGVEELVGDLVDHARGRMPRPGQVALNNRHRLLLDTAHAALLDKDPNLLIIAEKLRTCRTAVDKLTGRAATDDMLDALFGRFCLGK